MLENDRKATYSRPVYLDTDTFEILPQKKYLDTNDFINLSEKSICLQTTVFCI